MAAIAREGSGTADDPLENYEEVKTLGRGAFGVATLVKSRAEGEGGALRVIKQVDLSILTATALEESHKEVGVLQRLTHKHIIAYFDTFMRSSTLYIVMEYADGGDLASLIRQKKDDEETFSEDEAMTIFAQCLSALQFIHSKRILHRDIKSQNIFMMAAGEAKIGDFGISKVIETTTAAQGTVVGTPSYFAPEICEDKPYGPKIDVWSMGVVLYEMLALVQPFTASNVAALIMKIVNAEPAPLPDSCREEVRDVVRRALNKNPEERATAEELMQLQPVKSAVAPSMEMNNTTLSMADFVKEKDLGRGAYGVAVLVKHRETSVLRVVKTVDLGGMSALARKSAEDEVSLLHRLFHPHIIAYFDTFIEADKLHIVLEYADGGDLYTEVQRRQKDDEYFSEDEAMTLFRQCLSALAYIHKKKILHRDIKTQNIFLMKSGDAKLGDFGISKVMDETMVAGTVVGTPAYLAPEICNGAKYGSRIDVWSLGAVLYEILALKHPFQASNMAATLMKIISQDPAPLPDRCSEEVKAVVALALQKDQHKRPSAKELLAHPAVKQLGGEATARLDASSGLDSLASSWDGGKIIEEDENLTLQSPAGTLHSTEFRILDHSTGEGKSLKGILEAEAFVGSDMTKSDMSYTMPVSEGDTLTSLTCGRNTGSGLAEALEISLQGTSTLVPHDRNDRLAQELAARAGKAPGGEDDADAMTGATLLPSEEEEKLRKKREEAPGGEDDADAMTGATLLPSEEEEKLRKKREENEAFAEEMRLYKLQMEAEGTGSATMRPSKTPEPEPPTSPQTRTSANASDEGDFSPSRPKTKQERREEEAEKRRQELQQAMAEAALDKQKARERMEKERGGTMKVVGTDKDRSLTSSPGLRGAGASITGLRPSSSEKATRAEEGRESRSSGLDFGRAREASK